MKKKLFSLILALVLCLSAMPAYAVSWTNSDAPATRSMVAAAIWELEESPVVNYLMPFTDVSQDAVYAEAVRWAAAEKITSGVSVDKFSPNSPVTREQLAVMLWRYAKHEGMDVSIGEDTNILSYNDSFQWSDWAVPALQWAVGSGLLHEDSEDNLNAQKILTQSETAEIIRLFGDKLTLSLWVDGSPAQEAITIFMQHVTTPGSPYFIPVEDRIAVFDLDGTLFCETDPNYFDYTLLKYRVLEDPSYKDKASDFEKEVANKIKEQNETGKSFSGLEVDHGKAVASAFKGMTPAEFSAYIQEFKKQPMPSYDGMLRGEGWYKPMLQIVDYLQQNNFTVYVVSGTDRFIVRGIVENSPLNIPSRQIIGSDELLVADHQGETDGLQYVFTDQDKVVLGGEFLIKNLKMNKVSVILQEIGQQPVLSFGNSTGDSSMAEYVTTNNKYESLAFMLCCDDTVRENGSESKAQKMFELCGQFDWIPISMKNDWTTIYGDGVTKK
ncbi:MAG: S-layer homology domain-containing protein [Clostridium sp.]|nr:S-layer homology domain-containing protein [Clostridium sp.]